MTRPVLLLGTEPRVVVTVARSLHRRGIPVTIATLSPQDPRLSSRAIRNFVRLPSHRDSPSKFIEGLSRLIRTEKSDMLIPCSDTALAAVAQHYNYLSTLLYVACPHPHIVKYVLDKNLTVEVAKRCGITIPATYLVSNSVELENLRDTLRFPMIIKPRSKMDLGTHAFKVRYFQTFQELSDAFMANAEFGTRTLLQEYCTGEGVGIGALIHKGEPLAMFQHRRLKELPSTGGVSVLAISEMLDSTLAKQALELLRALEWEGVGMVEFRYDRTNRTAVLMEVNGRYWGSLPLAIHAGIDFPFYEWQLAHGETPRVPSDYQVGMRVRWITGDILRLHGLFTDSMTDGSTRRSRWKESVRLVTDCRPYTRGALWSVADPVPALLELSDTLRKLMIGGTKAIIRRLIPGEIFKHIKVSRSLGRRDGLAYAKLQFFRALGVRRDHRRRLPPGLRSVLFVCHGNIIRSPMAEALLRRSLSDAKRHGISVTSAGLYGNPALGADARAVIVAKEFGISLDDHRSQPLTGEIVEQADAIFVMDYLNEAMLLGRHPEARPKVLMLGAISQGAWPHPIEITDPYNGDTDDIRRCYETLQTQIYSLAGILSPSNQDKERESQTSAAPLHC